MTIARIVFFAIAATIPSWPAIGLAEGFDCSGLKDLNAVVALIGEQKTCQDAARIYRGCEATWTAPDMEQATIEKCEESFKDRLTKKQAEQYDLVGEACVEKYQNPKDMRVLWSAVRSCRVKSAEGYARRYGKK